MAASSSDESSDDEAVVMAMFMVTTAKRTHEMWVRDLIKKRSSQSTYNLVREMALGDEEMYFRYMGMTPSSFEYLFVRVAPFITKQTTNYREPISPGERLSITLRHLATGESHISLSLQFRVGRATVSKLIPEVCHYIYQVLSEEFVQTPKTPEEWLANAKKFAEMWNLQHVIGAFRIQCPKKTGTLYHNFKGFFSMNLMAICDAELCFTMFDIGQYGSNNDSGVLLHSETGQQFANGLMNLPEPETVEGCLYDPLPYYLVGDEIFPLKTWLMRLSSLSRLRHNTHPINIQLQAIESKTNH